jgi:hypothetical protein
MRLYILALGLLLASCATTAKDAPLPMATGLSEKTLAAGECGLYVWTADSAKTFMLFAAQSRVTYLKNGIEVSLTEKNPTIPPSSSRKFMDENGQALSLTLLSPQQIDEGTRYKSGRMTSLSDDGWEKVVPVVGFYACQPEI